jgi:lantibiotic modifying enzyme
VLSYAETVSSDEFDASEILFGRAGYLTALLYLLRHLGPKSVPNEVFEKVIDTIITVGKKGATKKCPLMYEWHGKAYLGGAHGLTGILAVLLQCGSLALTKERTELIKKSIDYVEALVLKYKGDFPSRENGSTELVQWCHGPVGPIILLVLASKIFNNESYLKTAQLAGEVVWQKGLLIKGAGLCHGVSGNGYSFLTLFRATKDKKWLHRAVQFGLAYANPEYNKRMRTPDRPYSLYEGIAGIVCYYIDLLDPEHSYFPGVEWPE